MLRSGEDHLESLRDGRVVYVGGERIMDVTRHHAVRNAARTVADVYDLKRRRDMLDILSFDANGERFSMHFLLPRGPEDLLRRMRAHKVIADATYGLFGRSVDHVASFIAGMMTLLEYTVQVLGDAESERRLPAPDLREK